MNKILSSISLIIVSFLSAQEIDPPRIISSTPNKELVDNLIEITDFEIYFKEYCKRKIDQKAKIEKWSKERTQKIINSINFKFYKNSIYNAFSFDTEENLKDTIDLFTKLNKNRNNSMSKIFPFDALMQYNLDGYIETLLEGKYIKN